MIFYFLATELRNVSAFLRFVSRLTQFLFIGIFKLNVNTIVLFTLLINIYYTSFDPVSEFFISGHYF